MHYSRVYIESIGYELAPVVVTTGELEARLEPVYRTLRLSPGQLEAWTGIYERRWWEEDFPVSQGAILAGRKALANSRVKPQDIGVLIYAGVCRDQFEPATACRVAAGLGIGSSAMVYDVSNACLGVLNGMIDIANRIELGQIRAGLVVSCESAREINDIVIDQLNRTPTMEAFKDGLATLTGGSGAVAVLVTDGSFGMPKRRQLLGGVHQTDPQHHHLCRWGVAKLVPTAAGVAAQTAVGVAQTAAGLATSAVGLANTLGQQLVARLPGSISQLAGDALGRVRQGVNFGYRNLVVPFMQTDAVGVLKHGVDLGLRTWKVFADWLAAWGGQIDKYICHQVGSAHRDMILKTLNIPPERDFSTYPYLGNMGTVSLPLTAALAEEQEFLQPGDRVSFLGIGSGLNCLMLGLRW
jgi:3-oxoacyl-[acyl-carrier-protein] synthase-3